MTNAVDEQLASAKTMVSVDLRAAWRKLTGGPAPRVSPNLLRLALAWEIQARAYGGLSRETVAELQQIANGTSSTGAVGAGMRLVREWKGKVHVVIVQGDGQVHWEERRYGSLSEVARAITGTRWSGPAFFGLKRKIAA